MRHDRLFGRGPPRDATLAAPASAHIIGTSPDSTTLTDPSSPTEAFVYFYGNSGPNAPIGGSLLAGSIDPDDEVISFRFNNTGSTDWTTVGFIPTSAVLGGIGVDQGGPEPTFATANGSYGALVVPVPVGESIVVFVALSGVIEGVELQLGVDFAVGSVELLLPEPPAAALVLCGTLLLAAWQRRLTA